MEQVGREAMAEAYDLLLGRTAYDIFASSFPNSDNNNPTAEKLNHAKKYVVTSNPREIHWQNSVQITGDIASEVSRLKEQDGPLLQVHGSWQLIQTLLAHSLIDEFRLWTCFQNRDSKEHTHDFDEYFVVVQVWIYTWLNAMEKNLKTIQKKQKSLSLSSIKQNTRVEIQELIMKIIDFTLTYEDGMRGVAFENAKSKSVDGWNSKILHLYSHAGTHMDAPFHFEVNSQTIDEFEVSRFVCDSLVIPIDAHAGQKIKLEDLGVNADLIKKGDGVILKTGWSAYVNENKYREELPGIHESLANWFVGQGINMLAVETPSIADVMDMEEVTKIHEILLGGDIIIVEGLTNLDSVTKEKVKLIALPLKIKGGDGAPARVIAIEK